MNKVTLWLSGAWRSRTMWFAAAMVVVGVGGMYGAGWAWLTPTRYGAFLTAVGVAIGALRSITSTSILGKIPGTTPTNPTMGPPKA